MSIFSFFSRKSDNESTQEPNYDRFGADEDLTWSEIRFNPKRYEVWRGGQKIKSGKTSSSVTARLDENGAGYKGLGQLLVHHGEKELLPNLESEMSFDMYGAQGNRRILFIAPTITNAKCIGMHALQQRWPHSRYDYSFNPTEPYCCSVFTVKGKVVKMTFHLDNPETLIELYGF